MRMNVFAIVYIYVCVCVIQTLITTFILLFILIFFLLFLLFSCSCSSSTLVAKIFHNFQMLCVYSSALTFITTNQVIWDFSQRMCVSKEILRNEKEKKNIKRRRTT